MQSRGNILLIEDDPDHAELVRQCLNQVNGWHFNVMHHSEVEEARAALAKDDIDLVLLDFRLGLDSGLDFLRWMRASGDHRPVVVLTAHGNEYLAVEMMRAGADDYIVKADLSPSMFSKVLGRVFKLRRKNQESQQAQAVVRNCMALLTPREREVLDLIVEGLTSKQISTKLHRSENTIKIHRGRVMQKMQASTVADLVRKVLAASAGTVTHTTE